MSTKLTSLQNNIMLTMGDDFNYQNANTWFKNLDKLIHYTNLDGRINAFYSTPTVYTNAKFDANITWTTMDYDYFPYADSPHAFWTGYFTSRPAIKGYVRSRSNYLQVREGMAFVCSCPSPCVCPVRVSHACVVLCVLVSSCLCLA